MTKPYSNDLRERAVAAVLAGDTARVVAARFEIAVSSVIKWHKRHRETGSVAPGKMGGHRKIILEPHRDFISEAINNTSHLTVRGLQAMLATRGVKVSHHAVWTLLRREGLSFKKKHCSALNRRVLMWPAGRDAGRVSWVSSTTADWSSLMKHGSRPTWRRSGDGAPKANA